MNFKKAEYTYIREAFMIRRYHTMGHVHMQDTVGHHTANVIGMLFFLCDDNPPIGLIKAALHHDVPELSTGDIPATTKWVNSELAVLLNGIEAGVQERRGLYSPELLPANERLLLKYADMMDLCFKSVEEIASGNTPFQMVLFNGLVYVTNLLDGPLNGHAAAKKLYEILQANPFVSIEEIYNGAEGCPQVKH
jgi:5'-deoxynucleotidase YfbR-like HD superfamily hydrolase